MIKTSGYRVSPSEVEEVVFESGEVSDLAVIGVPHPVLGQAIVLVACPREQMALNREKITRHCRERLPDYMIPMNIIEMNSLPKNPNGKIDRAELKRQFRDQFQAGQP